MKTPQHRPNCDERSAPPIRALVVEDNDDLRLVLITRLRMMGINTTPAANGEIALEHIHAAEAEGPPFDLILMDMEMPVVDGYEATRRLRGLGYQRPILAMTAHVPSSGIDCRQFGCNAQVSKPIDWDALGAAIKELVAKNRQGSGVNDNAKTGPGAA